MNVFNSEEAMPRYRGTKEGTPSLVGRLLLLVAAGRETSATLAAKLGVTPRQVNRYVLGLKAAGWRIERRGVPTHGDYWFELVAPRIVVAAEGGKKKKEGRGK
jgi:hypothetical protein